MYSVVFPTCSVVHVNYEQSLISMINTVPLKDYVGLLVTNILQLYLGSIGTEDGEQKNSKESEFFTTLSLIIAPEHVLVVLLLVSQRTALNDKNCRILLLPFLV